MRNDYYGGFIRRLAAFAVDWLVIGILTRLVESVCTAALGLFFSAEAMVHADRAGQALCLMMFFLYFVYFHGSTGRTPGKVVLGLKVIKTSGEPMGYGTAFLRWSGYLVSALFMFMGFIWIIFDGKKQGWHDKLTETYVVRAKRNRGGPELSYRDMHLM